MPLDSRSHLDADDAHPDALATLAELAGRHHLIDIERRCRTAQLQAQEGLVTVAVLGRFKAGKTTLLNQLLGEELLPVQAIPATAVITRLRFGPALRVTVILKHQPPMLIDPAELSEWSTETGNPGNIRQVDWIEVVAPALGDLDNLVLVDTPGTGSSWGHNTKTSLGWLPNVGAAIIAVNATQPLAEDDLQLIELVQPHTPNLFLVLTKIDLLTVNDLEAVTRHVRQQLHDRLPVVPSILTFSIADRHGSQRERLWQALRELNGSHVGASAELADHRVTQLATECRAYLDLAHAAAKGQAQAVTKLRHALDAETGQIPALRQQVRSQLQSLKQVMTAHAQDRVKRALPDALHSVLKDLESEMPGWKGSLATESSHFREWLQSALGAALTPFAAACLAQLEGSLAEGLVPAQRIGEAFVQRIGQLVHTATGLELDLPVPQPNPTPIEAVDLAVSRVFDSHLELLSWTIPMVLVRPAVHHHFLRMVPWEVWKNLSRTAYRTAAAAHRSLEQSVDDYLHVLADILQTCQHLVDSQPTDLPTINSDLFMLDDFDASRQVFQADSGLPDDPAAELS